MSRLTWGASGERYYENGVDRGVLYVGASAGVAWTGLISVDEAPTGGEARAFYQDGFKYLNISAREEYEATINAFSAPREFGLCDGIAPIQNGLFITQQPRVPFGFSYRTMIGNDTEGQTHGYKIHLVYNALAAPSQRNNASLGSDVSPDSLSWQITTRPPSLTGKKPTAHFIIDSRYTPGSLLSYIEGVLYGTDELTPRLPTVEELIDLFNSPGPIVARNLLTNPSVETGLLTVGKGFGSNTFAQDNTKSKTGVYSVKAVATGTSGMVLLWTLPTLPGNNYSFGLWVWVPTGVTNVTPTAYFIANGASNAVKDDWVWITHTFTATAATTQIGVTTGASVVGQNIWADSIIAVDGIVVPTEYFDGDTIDTDTEIYEWVGPPHASQSIKRSLA